MGRKKILVDIYLAQNLGDDLFLDHLAHSFPKIDFVPFHPGKNYASFFRSYLNICQFPYSVADKIKARLGKNKLTDYDQFSKTYDGILFLGGGIFREESYWRELYDYRLQIINAFNAQKKPVVFSGCSFGPYQTTEFVEMHSKLFEKANKIIFRDQYSYKLFSSLSNVSYAPDMLWSYDLPIVEKGTKILGLSVIDPRHKENFGHTFDSYIASHRALCEKYLQKGFEVKLFSFCEAEGDLAVAQEIGRTSPEVEILNYTNNISSYLKEIGKCTRLVAARFHAVIIAMKYNIPVIPVVYGDKTENLLKDLDIRPPFVKLESILTLKEAEFTTLDENSIKYLEQQSIKHLELNF